jgi:transposase
LATAREVNAFYGKVLITESLNSVQEVNERTKEVLPYPRDGERVAECWVVDSTLAGWKEPYATGEDAL